MDPWHTCHIRNFNDGVKINRVETSRVETGRVETNRVKIGRVETGRVKTGNWKSQSVSKKNGQLVRKTGVE